MERWLCICIEHFHLILLWYAFVIIQLTNIVSLLWLFPRISVYCYYMYKSLFSVYSQMKLNQAYAGQVYFPVKKVEQIVLSLKGFVRTYIQNLQSII